MSFLCISRAVTLICWIPAVWCEKLPQSTFFQEGFKGPLEDTRCNVEVVEEANRGQLYPILNDLSKVTFFRLFRVDMEGKCANEEDAHECSSEVEEENPFEKFLPGAKPEKKTSCAIETDLPENVKYELTTAEMEQTESLERNCNDENLPEFWMDICSAISTNASSYINLELNPHTNTGYDGSKIWADIYKENCFISGSLKQQCYEEKVMYRLLSAMHASTSISIFSSFYAPRKKGDAWKPNPKKFMDHFGQHPEWLKNLHFAFVVILRSLRKAKNFLAHYDYSLLGPEEKTSELINLLVRSDVMSLCSQVFDSFDEKTLFRNTSGSSLRHDFKRAFQSISRLLNCVTCQRCKIHAKLHILGIGTALKILLLPDYLYTTSISREEIVALVNTAKAFSESIHDATKLTQLYEEGMRDETSARTASVFGIESLAVEDVNNMSDEKVRQLEKAKHAIDDVLTNHYQKNRIMKFDAVVVGSGLAGMTVALTILERGGTVALVEKEKKLGGNSNKASSGINAAMTFNDLISFADDTAKSAGRPSDQRIELFVKDSRKAVEWLQRQGIQLNNTAQLGGHSIARTLRPPEGMIGAEVTFNLEKQLRSFSADKIRILTETSMTSLLVEMGETHREVFGIKTANGHLYGPVVLATGGFGHNFLGKSSLMTKYRPDLLHLPTTLGTWTQGDGIKIATSIGADVVDMEKVQVHPTGFIAPHDPDSRTKTLAGEILRGVGGILLNQEGRRFCDELGTRAYIVDRMMEQKGNATKGFWLILGEAAANEANRHIKLYSSKGLMKPVARSRLDALIPGALDTLKEYHEISATGNDPFGKKYFHNVPASDTMFYVGQVTPVIHYTMGGIRVNDDTQVLTAEGQVIQNLFAVGEVSGGLHGNNRLGGNSLLECAVFGRKAGKMIDIGNRSSTDFNDVSPPSTPPTQKKNKELRPISRAELAEHRTKEDCWVLIKNHVYDLTEYVELHPGGMAAITDFAGGDATASFEAVHPAAFLVDFEEMKVGYLDESL